MQSNNLNTINRTWKQAFKTHTKFPRKALVNFISDEVHKWQTKTIALMDISYTMPLFFNGKRDLGTDLKSIREYQCYMMGMMYAFSIINTVLSKLKLGLIKLDSKK